MKKTELEKQVKLLKKYKVTSYTIEDDKITINGSLYLRNLTSCDKDFLKDTTINGSLDLDSLTSCDKTILIDNVNQLEVGYNKERSNCYFDNILSKVISIKKTKGYIIYQTPFEFIAQKQEWC